MQSSIVILTDYPDVALNEVRGRIISNTNKKYGIDYWIEPAVQVAPFSVVNCSFLLNLIFEDYTNENVIFVCLVNPAKLLENEQPNRLYVKLSNNRIIFCPDLGIINDILSHDTDAECYVLPEVDKMSFAGKYFYPSYIVSHLEGKLDISNLNKLDFLTTSPLKYGIVLHIDNFGNIKFNIPFSDLSSCVNKTKRIRIYRFEELISEFDVKITNKRFRNFPDSSILIYEGSSMSLCELGCTRIINAFPNIRIGDVINIL